MIRIHSFASFHKNCSGGIAILGVAGIALGVLLASMALNLARSYNAHSMLQQAADIGSIAGAVKYTSTEQVEDSKDAARKYYLANIKNAGKYSDKFLSDVRIDIDEDTGRVDVKTAAPLNTYFSPKDIKVGVTAAARGAVNEMAVPVEMTLVLDVTPSMLLKDKIGSLKSAATVLVENFFAANPDNRMAVVPFETKVRLDTAHSYYTWLDNAAHAKITSAGQLAQPTEQWQGCLQSWRTANMPFAGVDTSDTTPSVAPLQPFFDHERAYDMLASSGDAKPGNVRPNYPCRLPPILPLSQDIDRIKHLISSLDPRQYAPKGYGGTVGNWGLVWGFRTVSAKWQGLWFNSSPEWPSANATAVQKVVVFLTDGRNELPMAHSAYGGPQQTFDVDDNLYIANTNDPVVQDNTNQWNTAGWQNQYGAPPAQTTASADPSVDLYGFPNSTTPGYIPPAYRPYDGTAANGFAPPPPSSTATTTTPQNPIPASTAGTGTPGGGNQGPAGGGMANSSSTSTATIGTNGTGSANVATTGNATASANVNGTTTSSGVGNNGLSPISSPYSAGYGSGTSTDLPLSGSNPSSVSPSISPGATAGLPADSGSQQPNSQSGGSNTGATPPSTGGQGNSVGTQQANYDGLPNYYHWEAFDLPAKDREKANELLDKKMAKVCKNIKDSDILLYTIGFDVLNYGGQKTVKLLKECATDETKAYFGANTQELKSIFDDILHQTNKEAIKTNLVR